MIDIINDISILTFISKLSLENLSNKAIECIAHGVQENLISGENITEINLDFGKLYIKLEEEGIKYKFIPSKKLENAVRYACDTKESPLVLHAETKLKERIESTYKDLI